MFLNRGYLTRLADRWDRFLKIGEKSLGIALHDTDFRVVGLCRGWRSDRIILVRSVPLSPADTPGRKVVEFLKTGCFSTPYILAGVSRDKILLRSLTIPFMKTPEIPAFIRRNVGELLPPGMAVETAECAFLMLRRNGNKLEGYTALIRRDYLTSLQRALIDHPQVRWVCQSVYEPAGLPENSLADGWWIACSEAGILVQPVASGLITAVQTVPAAHGNPELAGVMREIKEAASRRPGRYTLVFSGPPELVQALRAAAGDIGETGVAEISTSLPDTHLEAARLAGAAFANDTFQGCFPAGDLSAVGDNMRYRRAAGRLLRGMIPVFAGGWLILSIWDHFLAREIRRIEDRRARLTFYTERKNRLAGKLDSLKEMHRRFRPAARGRNRLAFGLRCIDHVIPDDVWLRSLQIVRSDDGGLRIGLTGRAKTGEAITTFHKRLENYPFRPVVRLSAMQAGRPGAGLPVGKETAVRFQVQIDVGN